MQGLKWLMAVGLFLVVGFFAYQWGIGGDTDEASQAMESAPPSPVVTGRQSESIEPPPAPSRSGVKPATEAKSKPQDGGSKDVLNPFVTPPKGGAEETESADLAGDEQEPAPQADQEAEQSEATTRDLLKEVPDSYPIENAEAYYVQPEDRYPGNLGGPPPLKLPPINAAEPATDAESGAAVDEGGTTSDGLAPPAPF
jgi:hypothetical protein